MYKYLLPFLFASALVLLPTSVTHAGSCYEPVTYVEWTGKVNSGVNVRDLTCMEQSTVIGKLSAGTIVKVVGEADGWYLVKLSDGTKGYVWNSFITITSKESNSSHEMKEEYQKMLDADKQKELEKLKASQKEEKLALEKKKAEEKLKSAEEKEAKKQQALSEKEAVKERLKGHVLLQVEEHGEAWYVHPDDGKRFYMKDGKTAYDMMRLMGLGITDEDLSQIPVADDVDELDQATVICSFNKMGERLKGKILLQVEQNGEAWYVHPTKCRRIYLKDGEVAYGVMRKLSLGISNEDLSKISSDDFDTFRAKKEAGIKEHKEKKERFSEPIEPSVISISEQQVGLIPAGVDLKTLNQYWLERINALRAERGLRKLALNQHWIDTATEWAGYMGEHNQASHDRPDGKSMHQWIDTKGLPFTVRYSEGGWRSNYFTENISWGVASDGSTSAVKKVLDDTMEFFLSEADWNGPHYRTIYHEDWNSVGVGFYFMPAGNGYKVYVAMHYGSLVQ